jgi:hypothetical protein
MMFFEGNKILHDFTHDFTHLSWSKILHMDNKRFIIMYQYPLKFQERLILSAAVLGATKSGKVQFDTIADIAGVDLRTVGKAIGKLGDYLSVEENLVKPNEPPSGSYKLYCRSHRNHLTPLQNGLYWLLRNLAEQNPPKFWQTEKGLAKLLGASRPSVASAFDKLISEKLVKTGEEGKGFRFIIRDAPEDWFEDKGGSKKVEPIKLSWDEDSENKLCSENKPLEKVESSEYDEAVQLLLTEQDNKIVRDNIKGIISMATKWTFTPEELVDFIRNCQADKDPNITSSSFLAKKRLENYRPHKDKLVCEMERVRKLIEQADNANYRATLILNKNGIKPFAVVGDWESRRWKCCEPTEEMPFPTEKIRFRLNNDGVGIKEMRRRLHDIFTKEGYTPKVDFWHMFYWCKACRKRSKDYNVCEVYNWPDDGYVGFKLFIRLADELTGSVTEFEQKRLNGHLKFLETGIKFHVTELQRKKEPEESCIIWDGKKIEPMEVIR